MRFTISFSELIDVLTAPFVTWVCWWYSMLSEHYAGPVSGLLQEGIIYRNSGQVLEPKLVTELLESLGAPDHLQV